MPCAAACAYGGGTVINAIATGIGAAFPIALRVEAEACEAPEDRLETYAQVDLAPMYRALREARARLGLPPARVRFAGDLPTAGGLKSSSAALNAMLTALARLHGLDLEPLAVARLNAEISRAVGISVTGAFDDAVASLLARSHLTDNLRLEVIRPLDVSGWAVVLIPPAEKRRHLLDAMRAVAPAVRAAVELAREGRWREAMAINAVAYGYALGYPPEPTLEAMAAGAVGGLSGTGPSHVFVVEDRAAAEELARRLSRHGWTAAVEIPRDPCGT